MDRIAEGAPQTVRLSAERPRVPLPLPKASFPPSIFSQQGAAILAGNPGVDEPDLDTTKVKLSTVLDQGNDTEIKVMGTAQLRVLLSKWKRESNDGEEPAEDEEATAEQISALAHRLRLGSTPFVDFGIWRAHGSDLSRVVKFAAHFPLPGGGYSTKEIVGPSSYAEWEKSWRVYTFAMEVLGAASRTRMDKYRKTVAHLNTDYPNFWWLLALADIKMRKVHIERIRRRLAEEHAELTAAGLRSDFNPELPWDASFREAARDRDFWAAEVDKKVIQFTTSQRTRTELTDPGFGDLRFSSGAGSGNPSAASSGDDHKRQRPGAAGRVDSKKQKTGRGNAPPPPERSSNKGAGKGKTKDFNKKDARGNYMWTADGKQICWAWNRSKSGCGTTCRDHRAHVCEICRGTQGAEGHRGCEH